MFPNKFAILASILGGITTKYYECSMHDQGSAENCLKTYVDSQLPAATRPLIINIDSNTRDVAFGIKIEQAYAGFILVGYSGVFSVIKNRGTWTTKQLNV